MGKIEKSCFGTFFEIFAQDFAKIFLKNAIPLLQQFPAMIIWNNGKAYDLDKQEHIPSKVL